VTRTDFVWSIHKPVLHSRWRWRTGKCNDKGHCVDRTQIHVIGREIPHAYIWTADGIASCYATTQTANSISVLSQNAPFHTLLHPLWHLTQLAELSFTHRAQHRSVKTILGSKMICIQTSECILACPQQQPIILLLQIPTSEYVFNFPEIHELYGMQHDRHGQ